MIFNSSITWIMSEMCFSKLFKNTVQLSDYDYEVQIDEN